MTKDEAIELALIALNDMFWDVYISFSGKEQPSGDDVAEAMAILYEMKSKG